MSTILGNPITLGGGGSKVPDYAYTGNAEWYNEEKTILKLKTSGVLTLSKDCVADVFVVGGGASGSARQTNDVYQAAGGGGGGYTKNSRVQFSKNTEYSAIVGAGGAKVYAPSQGEISGNVGGSSSINGVIADGGKTGSKKYIGGDGGSGGGGGNAASYDTSTVSAGGSDGSNGNAGISNSSGKQNAGGIGQGTTTRAFGESTGELFSGGGGGANRRSSYGTYAPAGGDGGGGSGACSARETDAGFYAGDGVENTGGGGGGGIYGGSGAGGSGVILIRFAS